MRGILPFLIALIAVAFFTQVDAFFYLLYALFGIYFLGRLWARRSVAAVALRRHHERRVFLGERFTVDVVVHNRGRLPVLWLRLHDTVPADLTLGTTFRQVISLGPREQLTLPYELTGRRRGYYRLGPLVGLGGDLLGLAQYDTHQAEDDFVVVYPKIVPLHDLGFPSQSPFGTLPSRERIFEDPTRIQGVRDYQPGDSLRSMDWKTSARLGQLQVRRYEPAIALETAIFLNLDGGDYAQRHRQPATELGIVIAASLAAHVVEKRQAIGLATNGRDPFQEPTAATALDAPFLPLRKGREHLMHLLDLLARVEVVPEGGALPFLDLLSRRSLGLPWGSTVVVVTADESAGLLDSLLALHRRGLVTILVTTYPETTAGQFALTRQRAEQIGVQALEVWSEQGLDIWR
jgi:uncharacterized protein (DUF58 family)